MGGAYREAAWAAWSAGLNPIPLWASGKPMEEWAPFQEARIDHAQVEEWCRSRRHYRANLGSTLGGPTGLCVVDVDDPDFIDAALDRFGWTPAQVATPSGGRHLYFANPGNIATRNARRFTGADAMPLDILGNRGFVKLPPSQRKGTDGYRWHVGDWEALSGLPEPNPGSIPGKALEAPGRPAEAAGVPPCAVPPGQRNSALYSHLRDFAVGCDDEAQIVQESLRWNADLPQPLPVNEALKVAGSVARMKARGDLWGRGGEPMVGVKASALDELDPDSLFLLMRLRREHAGLRGEFALSPPAMAAALGWRKPRFMKARDALVTARYLVRTHQGGAGKHDPARFRFAP